MVILHTSHGDITLELDAANAPATVANFLQYVRDGHYDNTIFHRVIDGFMIQGGGMEPGMKQKPVRAPIANEAGNGLKNKRYTVAMARTSDPHSATAQFFVNVADNDFLDHKGPSPQGWGYCVFGKVVAGQDVVDKIKGVATGEQRLPPERPDGGRRDHARRGSRIKPALFISDLHLSPARPALVAAFDAFCTGPARAAAAVYVLGDLFDAWIGDDQLREPLAARRRHRAARRRRRRRAGRRDDRQPRFPARPALRRAAGATLLPERIVVDVAGTPTLLLHGDELCTDDVAYQRFRAIARNPHWQRRFLALPYALRRSIAAWLRGKSRAATAAKPEDIMDVEPRAVDAAFREAGVTRMIHGHTHRPAHHTVVVDGRDCERWVLADWYDRGSYLECDDAGGRTRAVPASA